MKPKLFALIIVGSIFAILLFPPERGMGQEPKLFIPDKALCAKMLRFGKEAYQRAKYLDAKEYFRKAVQADPTSLVAWRYYDQALIFALAEKVEKDASLVLPDVSSRQELSTGAPPTPPSLPSESAPAPKDTEFRIVDDEGC
jgi:hypothetical protein